MSVRLALAAILAAASIGAASAQVADGRYSGASSIAGGTGKCWGNAPADATIAGGQVTIRYVGYDGTQTPIVATLGKDGSFTASQPIKDGKTIAYSGKATARTIVATWKGPDCYGTLDLSR